MPTIYNWRLLLGHKLRLHGLLLLLVVYLWRLLMLLLLLLRTQIVLDLPRL
jgi:hypothetical protein